ncbi:MAG: 4-alpha-glucanotransferase [Anaerolineae bacterium]|jgi:4-alpha-glucanotransferase|nr:4-alpha-glucanotransferase [Anaerolineae bacterium]
MPFPRASGVLCHPTSFPSRFGIGDLGRGAYQFIDWLATAKQQLWQVLPLGPTGYGDSPYQCFSAFAGNPMLISPEGMAHSGLLPHSALSAAPDFPGDRVDFGPVIGYKQGLLRAAYEHFKANATREQRAGYAWFQDESASWLPDYALFMAIKAQHGGGSWHDWPRALRLREAAALAAARAELADEVGYHAFLQWVFWDQWSALKARAAENGIRIIGDVPIFVAEDSADVWANPEQFKLDEEGNPTVIAGVPPDLFSASGQRWGNPHYNWEQMRADGYRWWIDRVKQTLKFVDIARIDHFRGFAAAWEIPADEETAIAGKWIKAPGRELFVALRDAIGELPFIAEDLGVITPDVDALRLEFDLPGMKILQFAFGMELAPKYLPHNYESNSIVYPGTHDNNTTVGYYWEPERTELERHYIRRYLRTDAHDIAWDFIWAAWSSASDQAVATLQDVMSLGAEARMNFPSRASGNWHWRYTEPMLASHLAYRLADLTEIYERSAPEPEEEPAEGAEAEEDPVWPKGYPR